MTIINSNRQALHSLGWVILLIVVITGSNSSLTAADDGETFTYRALDILWQDEVWKLFPPRDGAKYGTLSWDDVTIVQVDYCPDDSPYVCVWTPYYA